MNSFRFTCGYSSFGLWGILLSTAVLAGCGRDDVQVYKVAKEQPQRSAPGGMEAAGGMGMPAFQAQKPAAWEEVPPGEMRAASYRVNGENGRQADVSVIPLPGMAGDDLANVNRWRGQVGLEPVSEAELAKLVQAVPVAGQMAQLYDLAGENTASGEKTRILAAILRREDATWFFKMTGDAELVEKQKPAFIEFMKSSGFGPPMAHAELPASHPPIGDASMMPAASAAVGPGAGGNHPAWQVPADWQEVSAGGFLVAKFTISGTGDAQAAVNVSMSAGEGGGLVGNVNRWRQQLGLSPVPDGDVAKLATPIDTAAGKASLVDMTGTDARNGQKARLIGVVVPQGDQTWFYKLMGSEPLVAAQKDAFTRFVQSVKY